MNIAGIFLNNELRTGGHTRYLQLMDGMARRGNEVTVLVNRALDRPLATARAIPCEARYRRRSLPPASWVFWNAVGRNADRVRAAMDRVDAVLVYGETHLAAGHRLARALEAPLVYGHRSNTVREYLTYLSEPGHRPREIVAFRVGLAKSRVEERRIARLSDLVVFQSPFDRDDFLGRVPAVASRSAVIPGSIREPRFLPVYGSANRSETLRKVVFIGTLGIRKGVDYLVEAIILLAQRGLPPLSFEICGPGDRTRELEGRIARAGVPFAISFRGRIPDPFAALSNADLLVVPSLFDSYPNTVLEALHVGIPVIGSRVGGIPDMLRHDDLLFPPMDAAAIADRIEKAVREPSFYRRLRELCAGRRGAFQFDWSEAWENAIRRMQATRAGRGSGVPR